MFGETERASGYSCQGNDEMVREKKKQTQILKNMAAAN